MWPALVHVCGKQTPSSRIIFFCKRWALAFYVCVRICYMFPIPKCRGESDLVLCTTSGLAKRIRLRGADFQLKTYLAVKIAGSRHCAAALFLQVPKLCTDLDRTLLYILILRTHTKFVRENMYICINVCTLIYIHLDLLQAALHKVGLWSYTYIYIYIHIYIYICINVYTHIYIHLHILQAALHKVGLWSRFDVHHEPNSCHVCAMFWRYVSILIYGYHEPNCCHHEPNCCHICAMFWRYVSIQIYGYIYIWICIYIHIYICIHLCLDLTYIANRVVAMSAPCFGGMYTYIYMDIYIYVYAYIHIYVYIHLCLDLTYIAKRAVAMSVPCFGNTYIHVFIIGSIYIHVHINVHI